MHARLAPDSENKANPFGLLIQNNTVTSAEPCCIVRLSPAAGKKETGAQVEIISSCVKAALSHSARL